MMHREKSIKHVPAGETTPPFRSLSEASKDSKQNVHTTQLSNKCSPHKIFNYLPPRALRTYVFSSSQDTNFGIFDVRPSFSRISASWNSACGGSAEREYSVPYGNTGANQHVLSLVTSLTWTKQVSTSWISFTVFSSCAANVACVARAFSSHYNLDKESAT